MDDRFELKGISFVWDSNKAQLNLAKHRIAFTEAAHAFFNPFLRVADAGTDEQARDAIVAMDEQWNLLYVVHILLEEDGIRIISARKATPVKRHYYEY